MNPFTQSRPLVVAATIILLSLAANSTYGQSSTPITLKGAYVLSEQGAASADLAYLTFSGAGAVAGTEVVQASNPVATYSVQGTYTINPDNTGIIALTGTSTDTTDAAGN